MNINMRFFEHAERNNRSFYIYDLKAAAGEAVFDAHWHTEFEILYAECNGMVKLDAKEVPLAKDSFVFINTEQLHQTVAYANGRIFAMVFDFELLAFNIKDFCQTNIINALKTKSSLFPQCDSLDEALCEEIKRLLKSIIDVYYSNTPGYELKIKCNLYEIIFLLYSGGKFIPHEKEKHYPLAQIDYVKKAVAYMEANYPQPVTIDDLARCVSINKYYFIKLFRQITGEAPMVFLRNLRIDISRDVLVQGCSVTQAALMSGFTNVSYYIRHFKNRHQVTPKKYQDLHRQQ